ncbi:MAG TPA: hypothetical protein VEP90_07480 [Methylomirabilota bacterium]|nr:hypothetical protein [Methylomirabilota bacterium]
MDDEFIGYAILGLMFMFMYVWITSPVSPINFPGRANVAVFVSHISVILVVIIPFTLLGLIEALFGNVKSKVETGSGNTIQNATNRLKRYRTSHAGKYGRYKKDEPEKA